MFDIKNKKVRGFTLIELLIALGITVILGGVGTANYFNYQSVQVIEGAASELLGTFRDAYQRAISQDQSSAWGVYLVNTADSTANDYFEIFYGDSRATGTVLARTNLPAGLEFLLPPAPALPQVTDNYEEIIFAKSTGLTTADHTVTIQSSRDRSLLSTININESTGFITSFTGLSDAPVADSISPDYVLNDEAGPGDIYYVSGSNFQARALVKFTKSGQNDIECAISNIETKRLTITCDVTAATIGLWDVVVTNPDNQISTLSSALGITTTGGNISGYAWSDNDGYTSFSCSNDLSCLDAEYGVDVDPITGLFSGYAWTDNSGWIGFETTNLAGCPSGTCEARVTGGFIGTFPKAVTGWARICSMASNETTCSGGSDGFISLAGITSGDGGTYGVALAADGMFSGFAYEPDVIGWISFASSTIAYPYAVEATW